jgi:cyclic pyranopterin phosphate synthase
MDGVRRESAWARAADRPGGEPLLRPGLPGLVARVKLPGHGINDPGFLQPSRPMSAIGG